MVVAFRIVKTSLLALLVDSGRFGYQHWGYPQSGALDRLSIEMGNRALGNPPQAAALEVTLIGPQLQAERPLDILITGADLSATVNGALVPLDTPLTVDPGDVIKFGKRQSGCRAYLCVRGGFSDKPTLGSVSPISSVITKDRKDMLYVETVASKWNAPISIAGDALAQWRDYWSEFSVAHFVWGPQSAWFDGLSRKTFTSQAYTVTPQSSRVAVTLEGPILTSDRSLECLSDPSPLGAIQVPPSGRPLVLLNDRGTTGGYAKIGTVVSYDCYALAQIIPGKDLRFTPVETDSAPIDRRIRDILSLWQQFESLTGTGDPK